MKPIKLLAAIALAAGIVSILSVSPGFAQRGYGMHGGMWGGYDRGSEWSYCPYCGSSLQERDDTTRYPGYGPHHGRWGRGGYGMEPGMMGPGHRRWNDDPDDRRGAPYRESREEREPLKKKEAQSVVKEMLEYSRNPNLKVGQVTDKNDYFVVEVVTKGGALVDKLRVDKQTGRMRSEY